MDNLAELRERRFIGRAGDEQAEIAPFGVFFPQMLERPLPVPFPVRLVEGGIAGNHAFIFFTISLAI